MAGAAGGAVVAGTAGLLAGTAVGAARDINSLVKMSGLKDRLGDLAVRIGLGITAIISGASTIGPDRVEDLNQPPVQIEAPKPAKKGDEQEVEPPPKQ